MWLFSGEKQYQQMDIFFCSEDTARLTFKKTGTAREMMKSFTEEYPISIVASTQRIVHSPKRHTFGSVMYDAKKQGRNRVVWTNERMQQLTEE